MSPDLALRSEAPRSAWLGVGLRVSEQHADHAFFLYGLDVTKASQRASPVRRAA